MSWLRRAESDPPTPPAREPEASERVETAAPGIAAMLENVSRDGSHAILDLGPGTSSSLDVYGRFARQVRFADVPGYLTLRGRGSVSGMHQAVPPHPGHPYDLVFGWDVLDRLYPEYHAPLVTRLAEITAPNARLHVVVRASEAEAFRPLTFMIAHKDRMYYEPSGPPQPARQRLLPAYISQLLMPFRVAHGFTLKGRLREYVAVRTDD